MGLDFTEAEWDCIVMAMAGLPEKEMAHRRSVGVGTIKKQLTRARKRARARSTVHLCAMVARLQVEKALDINVRVRVRARRVSVLPPEGRETRPASGQAPARAAAAREAVERWLAERRP